MTNRKAFTLVELLVVIGIIAVLAGILLPVVNRVRGRAQITGQEADFQTITSALESYKADFGDYPRNDALTRWYTGSTLAPQTPAPIHLSLAAALLGAGPQVTQVTSGGVYMVGDGADGLGFRAQSTNYPVTVSLNLTGAPPSVTVTSTLPPQVTGAFIPGQTTGSITMSVGTTYEETVGFVVDANTPSQLDLTSPTVYSSTGTPSHQTTDKYLIKVPTGKITPNYLSADTFKVAYVPVDAVTGGTGGPGAGFVGSAGEPLLLDRWGQVIQYFPRYGPANNRTADSVTSSGGAPVAQPTYAAGPLFGYSQPYSVDNAKGQNAVWDFRDGAPYFSATPSSSVQWKNPVTGNIDQLFTWPDPTTDAGTGQPEFAIEWMLGDLPTSSSGTFNNAIVPGEKLNFDGPYILISTGPDGPERKYGGYCPLSGVQSNLLLQTFTTYGNVYNFDHP